MSDNAIRSTTQEFLDVYDIVNDMVLLKDGTATVILQIGTMNFSLLAEQEQDAVIFTYGSLLNSLNYPIQINIQSQTKDATKYLRLLDEQITKASSDRKATLIKKYRDFVAALIKERNVLQKRFYISVPASPGEMGLISASGVLPGKTVFDISTVDKSVLLEKANNILEPRKDHLTSQFNRLGLYVRQLSTQEIIQNFYINYNPEAVEGQEISSSENYTTPLVRASFGGKYMQLNNQSNDAFKVPTVITATDATSINNANPAPSPAPSSTPIPTPSPTTLPDPNPIAEYPSPEEILSGETMQNPATDLKVAPDFIQETEITQTQGEGTRAVEDTQAVEVSQTAEVFQAALEFTPQVTLNTLPDSTIIQQVQEVSQVSSLDPGLNQEVNQEVNPEISLSLDSSLINSSLSEPKLELPQIFADENVSSPTNTPQQPDSGLQQDSNPQQNVNVENNFTEEIVPLQNSFETQTQNQNTTT